MNVEDRSHALEVARTVLAWSEELAQKKFKTVGEIYEHEIGSATEVLLAKALQAAEGQRNLLREALLAYRSALRCGERESETLERMAREALKVFDDDII